MAGGAVVPRFAGHGTPGRVFRTLAKLRSNVVDALLYHRNTVCRRRTSRLGDPQPRCPPHEGGGSLPPRGGSRVPPGPADPPSVGRPRQPRRSRRSKRADTTQRTPPPPP